MLAACATVRGHALVDRELYLPKSWTEDRERCQAARIPGERTFATTGDLAQGVIPRAEASPLAIAWVTAYSAYGQDSHFRRFPEDAAATWERQRRRRAGEGCDVRIALTHFSPVPETLAGEPLEIWVRNRRPPSVPALALPIDIR